MGLEDAVIATRSDLDKLAEEYGMFAVAEKATDKGWVEQRRQQMLVRIAKTLKGLRHLDSSLQRMQMGLHSTGRPGSTNTMAREYHALEGWALTLVDNYAVLAGTLSRYDRTQIFERLQMYTEGAIANNLTPASHAGDKKMETVRGFLQDHRLMDA